MSYDIRVVNKKTGDTIELREKHGIAGGTYCVGGTSRCEFNITFNYAKWFYMVWPKKNGEKVDTTPFGQMFENNEGGLRSLYGLPLPQVIDRLTDAVNQLHGEPNDDYWADTEGNARSALFKLKLLCEMAAYENPDLEMTLDGD